MSERKNIIKIHLGRKDLKLKEWFRLSKELDRNTSQIIAYALHYYMDRNEYLTVGAVNTENASFPEQIAKTIYISNPAVLKWLEEIKQGQKITTTIKMILDQGISETAGKGNVAKEAELFRKLYSSGKETEQKGVSTEVQKIELEPDNDSNEEVLPLGTEEYQNDDDAIMEQLMSAMLPSKESGLGL